ncbi:MAG: SRPBCC family protein [Flammeovirgaceae bacterium]
MELSESIIINRSASAVFEYYTDFSRHPEFIHLLEETQILTDGELGVGSEFLQIGEAIIGGDLKMHSKVTAFSIDERVTSITIDGGNQIEQDLQIEPLDEQTAKVTYTTRVFPPKSIFGRVTSMVGGLLKSQVSERMKKDMLQFKANLEASS